MPGLHFDITADNKVFIRSVDEIERSVRNASQQIESEGGDIEAVFTRIQKAAALSAAGFSLKEFVGKVASTRGEFQQLEVAFNTMLGSEEKAVALMDQLVRTAATTPFDLQGIAQGAKQLLAYGLDAEDVNGTLVRLGDIAAGLSVPLNDLVYLYGTTMAQGRLYTQDLNQFTGRGIPMIGELAKQFGVAESQVKKLVEEGKVGFPEVQKVIESLTNDGGKFGGLMEAQSKTIVGQISNIEDAIDSMFNEIGQSSEGIINTSLGMVSSLVENWQTVGVMLGDIAIAHGTQKAILIGMAAVTSSMYKAEMAGLAAVLPQKEQSVNLDVEEAVSKGRLSKASAERVIALRAEVKAQLENLAAAKASAVAEMEVAKQKYISATQQVTATEAVVAAKREELVTSGQIVGSTLSENAVKEMSIVTDKAKAAAIQATVAKQEYYAAVTKKKAAIEALDTATTNANAVAQTAHARSTNILTIAKQGLAAATKKLYATMMANPYALVTAAVVALGYGIYKLVTCQTEAEKSTKAIQEATDNVTKAYGEEENKLNELWRQLESAKKGSDKWKSAKDAIVSQYGQYLNGLDKEIEKTKDLRLVYDKLTKSIRESIAARGLKDFYDENDKSGERMKDWNNFVEDFKKNSKLQELSLKQVLPIIEDYAKNGAESIDDIFKHIEYQLGEKYGEAGYEFYNSIESKLKKSNLSKAIEMHKESKKESLDLKTFQRNNGISDEMANKVLYGIEPAPKDTVDKDSRSYWEQEVKNRKEAYEAILKADKEGSSKAKKAYDEAVMELNKYNSVGVKKSSGRPSVTTAERTAAKEAEAHRKLLDLLKSQADERLRLQQEYEYQEWQNRIDLMEEGEAKVLAQQKLNNSKELASLEEQKEQAVKAEIARQKALFDAREDERAAGNKRYAKRTFNSDLDDKGNTDIDRNQIAEITERYDSFHAQLLDKQRKAESDRLTAARESMNAYLKEFGDYQQKRLAIEEEYRAKIQAAENEGQRMQLKAQRNKALSDLDYSEWVDSGSIALAFGDISKLSDRTVKQLIADMEKYRGKVIATFDPEKIQKYEEALGNLRKLDADNSFGIFSMIPDLFKQRAAAQKELNAAEENYKNLLFEETKLQMQLNALKLKISTTVKQQTGRDITSDQAGDVNYLESLKSELGAGGNDTQWLSDMIGGLGDVQTQLNGVSQAVQGAQKSFGGLQKSSQSAFGLMDDETTKMIDTIVHGINDIVQGLNGTFSELSSTAEALGADMSEGSGWSQTGIIMQGFADASQGATEAWESFKNNNIIGVVQGVVKSFTSWIKAFAAFSDAKHEKKIQQLQKQIDALQKSYDKLGKAADDVFSTDASDLVGQQNTLLQQQKALIKQQMAEEEAKKKTDKEKIEQYQEQLEEIDEILEDNKKKAKESIIGEDVKSAIGEFSDAYASAWDDGTDAAQKSMSAVKSIITSALNELLKKRLQPTVQKFYDELAKAMEDGILTDAELSYLDTIKSQMDAVAAKEEEQYKRIQERYRDLDELREELTDISFDSVRDNFKSLLSDMESSTEDFTEDFTDMLRNAMIESLMDNKYDAMLKKWYEEFAKAMESDGLSDTERDALRQQYDAIVQQGIADRDAINDIVGGGAYSQSASTAGGWGSMGQDTAEELNGRFTALTELYAIGNEYRAEGNRLTADILATLRTFGVIRPDGDGDKGQSLLDIRDMMFRSTGYLEDIAKYTKMLNNIDQRLDYLNRQIDRKL